MDHINHSRFPIPPDQRESHHISFEQETLEILYGSFFSNANVLERFRALQIYAYHSQVTSLYTFFMDIGFALHDTISTDEGAYRLSSPSGKTVVIYGTHKEPIDEILDLPCTMNFATHDQVVFLYPATTFIRKQSLLLQKSIVPSLLHHFELNGLGMITMISALDALGSQSELSLKCRWIGDRHCLRLQLPALRCAETPTAMNTLKTTSWHLHCAEPNLVIVKKTSIHASNPPSTFTVAPYMEEIMLCWYISDEGLDSDHAPETTDKVLILPPYSCRNADTRGRTPPTSRLVELELID
ncbi:hypothetical protein VNI00_018079 [Paramarasmius palmivorus]|uniref:Uncharacterized protein n=1 Tax=Paramarasmius palmivorus TaxID=297713 RepID=A0AAW0B3Q0_9AGAR